MKKMSKKNITWKSLDGLKTYDGPNQSAKNLCDLSGVQYAYPNMKMSVHTRVAQSIVLDLKQLHGDSKPVVLLTDSLRLLEALAIMFEDTPIVEVVDMILDEAYARHEEKIKNE
tara:strand:+ start:238 stop:579 length:342 start_codon:yes stop_codon:yes gene_type:complete